MSIARRLKTAHFRLILRIAETGTLQSAAVEIAMSQPSASRMLAEIETLVGAPLFTRHAKGMMLTTIGETILRHARQILQGFDRLETDVQQVANGRAGFVRIGTVTGPAVGMVVPVVRTVRKMAAVKLMRTRIGLLAQPKSMGLIIDATRQEQRHGSA